MKNNKKSVAILFCNWTDQDFTHKWDNVEYSFKSGQSELIQDFLAHHFAKHLAQREINRKKLLMTDPKFKVFYDKCFSKGVVEADTDLKLEIEMEKKKIKKVNKKIKKIKEKEFEGLNEK